MKNNKFFSLILVFVTTGMFAQDIADHAIGLRLGDSDGFGAEISYQKSIGRYNRAEFNLGLIDNRNFDHLILDLKSEFWGTMDLMTTLTLQSHSAFDINFKTF